LALDLERLRKEIDRIDSRLLELLTERMKIVERIAELKREAELPIVDPIRRSGLLSKAERYAKEKEVSSEALRAIYESVIKASEHYQRYLGSAAFLGPRGTYSMEAATKFFGEKIQLVSLSSIKEIFELVVAKEVKYGVVPIENSLEGSYGLVMDYLFEHDVKICGEVILKISHVLAGNQSTSLSNIRVVMSHPQAIAQCRRFLSALKDIEVREVGSTAEAASEASHKAGVAAICSRYAADLYNLRILAENIADYPANFTRFLVISNSDAPPSGLDKTSIIFSVRHIPGALYLALKPFAERRINLTKIESRPVRHRPWEYLFYVDLEGHRTEDNVADALKELKEITITLKLLGSYPRASNP